MLTAGQSVTMTIGGGAPITLVSYTPGWTLTQYLSAICTALGTNGITAVSYPAQNQVRIDNWPSNADLTTGLPIAEIRWDTYRFSFQGQEHDDEINGSTATSYAFEYRMHDPRIGRFLSVDPLAAKFPQLSPYSFAADNPIFFVDQLGLEPGKDPPKENVIGIAAYREGSGDANAFKQRIGGLGVGQQFNVHNGAGFINALVTASKVGPITRLYVASHSSGTAVYMNPNEGLYGDGADAWLNATYDDGNFSFGEVGPNAATLQDLKDKITSGEIVFAEGAVVILLGCKTAFHPIPGVDSMAEELSEVIPGSQVTGATGNSYPLRTESSSGREVDSNTYFTEGVWMTYENGGACPVEKKDTVNVTEIERVSSPVGGRALTSPTGL
jgi:RHS repeat-associated protein